MPEEPAGGSFRPVRLTQVPVAVLWEQSLCFRCIGKYPCERFFHDGLLLVARRRTMGFGMVVRDISGLSGKRADKRPVAFWGKREKNPEKAPESDRGGPKGIPVKKVPACRETVDNKKPLF